MLADIDPFWPPFRFSAMPPQRTETALDSTFVRNWYIRTGQIKLGCFAQFLGMVVIIPECRRVWLITESDRGFDCNQPQAISLCYGFSKAACLENFTLY